MNKLIQHGVIKPEFLAANRGDACNFQILQEITDYFLHMEYVMRVSKWGNGLAVRLPKALVEELGLKPGDELKLVSTTSKRVVVAKDERPRLAVERMRKRAWPTPEGYVFNRDEANAR